MSLRRRFFGHTQVSSPDVEPVTSHAIHAPGFAHEDIHAGMVITGSWSAATAGYLFFPQDRHQFAPLHDSHLYADRLVLAVQVNRADAHDLQTARWQLREALQLLDEYRRVLPALPASVPRLEELVVDLCIRAARDAAERAFAPGSIVGTTFVEAKGADPAYIEVVIRSNGADAEDLATRTRRFYQTFEKLVESVGGKGLDVIVEFEAA